MQVLLAAMKHAHAQQAPTDHEARWLAVQEKYGGLYGDFKSWEVETDIFNRLRHRMMLLEAQEAEKMAAEM